MESPSASRQPSKSHCSVLTLDTSVFTTENDGLDELFVLIALVASLDGLHSILTDIALAVNETVNSNLDTLPTLVTVHGVVATDDGSELTNTVLLHEVEELLAVAGSRPGGSVTTVTEEVNINLRNLVGLGDLEELEQVVHVGVNATVGDETAEVKTTRGSLGVLHGLDNVDSVLELVLLDGYTLDLLAKEVDLTLVNLDNVLPYDTTSTNVQVAASQSWASQ